jgi:hypothetical protein
MRDKDAFLKDCVITIASDDYENFELIFDDAKRIASSKGMSVDAEEVAAALRMAVDEGLLEAFDLSPNPPHPTKVEYSADRLRELWYYVTPQGKALAKGMPFLLGESC